MSNLISQSLTDLSRCIAPRLCYACQDALIHKHQVVCTNCMDHMPFTEFHFLKSNPFIDKFFGRIHIHAGASFLYFSKRGIAQNIIHQLKYNGRPQVGIDVGKQYGHHLLNAPLFKDIDMIIPVPLHHKRQYYRGYNQSDAFGSGLSETMAIPQRTDIVIRDRATTTQTKKTRIERFANVDGAFKVVKPSALEGKHILLVDDVLTTGATLEGCAQELVKVPGVKLSMATIGFAYFQ